MRIRHEPFAQFEGRFDMGGLCSATAPNLGTVRDRGAIYVAEIVKGIQEADGEVHAPLLTAAGPEGGEFKDPLVCPQEPAGLTNRFFCEQGPPISPVSSAGI